MSKGGGEKAESNSKYFYMSTIKQSTAVTDCISANFTKSPKAEHEIITIVSVIWKPT
jgi:hypothetical protein